MRQLEPALLSALVRNERGTSLIELGIAAPLLLFFLAAVSDVGRGVSEKHRLKQVVNQALEVAQISTTDGDYDYLSTQAAAEAGAGATATVDQWLECGGSKRQWDDSCTGGDAARFIKLTVTKSFKPVFGPMAFWAARADGTILVKAHATLRVR